MMKEYITVFKKYVDFSGRASRREYWMFQLFNLIIAFVIGFISGLVAGVASQASGTDLGVATNLANIPGNIYSLVVFLPSLAVAIRRMHDTNKSGWYILIPFYSFYLTLISGDKGPNNFGPDPYGDQNASQTPPVAPVSSDQTPSGFTPTPPQA
jgi:uncharacterized membrane protein YhaH (DUF805 family)